MEGGREEAILLGQPQAGRVGGLTHLTLFPSMSPPPLPPDRHRLLFCLCRLLFFPTADKAEDQSLDTPKPFTIMFRYSQPTPSCCCYTSFPLPQSHPLWVSPLFVPSLPSLSPLPPTPS